MINENVRHIVEAELRAGETLFWAEVVSQRKIEDYLDEVAAEAKYIRGFNGPLSSILTFILLVMSLKLRDPFFPAILSFAFLAALWSYKRAFDPVNPDDYDFSGGYALTNLRFFTFDKSLTSWTTQDATQLKPAYEETKTLKLHPIGQKNF